VGFVVDVVAPGEISSEYRGLHLLLHTILSSWAGKIGPLVSCIFSGFSLTPPHAVSEGIMASKIADKCVEPMLLVRYSSSNLGTETDYID
jgi:hypothetical protein